MKRNPVLKKELKKLSDADMVLLDTDAKTAFDTVMLTVKSLTAKKYFGIIITANRPYNTLIEAYNKAGIDINKLFFVDCVTKQETPGKNVLFIGNTTALTNIAICIDECLQLSTKRFVLIDSITTMLLHNDAGILARFSHNLLTKLRMTKAIGILVTVDKNINKELYAELAQLCDIVIQI